MIVIFSERIDISTDNAIAWLHYYKKDFIRFNEDSVGMFQDSSINNKKSDIHIGHKNIPLSEIKSVWFRRGYISYEYNTHLIKSKSEHIIQQVSSILSKESSTISEYIYYMLQKKNCISDFNNHNVNKLISLEIAKSCGLNIPDTFVTGNSESLIGFMQKDSKSEYITKSLHNNPTIQDENENTRSVGTSSLKRTPKSFFYSLVQNRISRFCEVRVFYIGTKYFSMATVMDSRIIDGRTFANSGYKARFVPFKLPKGILNKLKKFVKIRGLNTGSIDLMLDPQGKFYFLEINPVGQYDYLEYYGNYPISKHIAQYLIK